MNLELYFDGLLAEHDNSETIAATYAINKIGQIAKRSSAKTNNYVLKFTTKNDLIFQNSRQINSASRLPYKLITHKAIIDGVLVFDGFAFIDRTNSGYNIQGFQNSIDFYSIIKSKKLDELDISRFNHVRNDVTIQSSFTSNDGYTYAAYNTGKWTGYQPNEDGLVEIIPDDLYPSLFVHTLIKQICTDAGYVLSGDILNDPDFLSHLMPFNKFPVRSESYSFSAVPFSEDQSSFLLRGPGNGDENYIYDLIPDSDPSNALNNFGWWVNPVKQTIKITMTYSMAAWATSIFDSAWVRTRIIKRNSSSNSPSSQTGDVALYNVRYTNKIKQGVQVEVTTTILPGEKIGIWVTMNDNTAFHVDSFSIETVEIATYDLEWDIKLGLPDITQDKLFLDVLNQYGLVPDIDNEQKTIELFKYNRIESGIPVDWSNKLDETEYPEVQFRFSDYAKSNYLRYSSDDILIDNFEKEFIIDDETLPDSKEVYKSDFYLPPVQPCYQSYVSLLNSLALELNTDYDWAGVWDSGTTYKINDVVFRNNFFWVSLQNGNTNKDPSSQPSWWEAKSETEIWTVKNSKPIYGSLSREPDENVVVLFQSGTVEINNFVLNEKLKWTYLYDTNYRLFNKIIKDPRIVEQLFKLNYSDINQLNFKRPVYIEKYGASFIIDEVKDFKFNQSDSTVVRIIRI